jgi:phage protein D
MADVRVPAFKVLYEGLDITEDISDDVVRITYSDADGGEADEIRITVDDMFAKWKDTWRPNRGDKISLSIGYAGEGLLDMGTFHIDEVHYRGQPDVVEFRALSVPIDSNLWTIDSKGYENITLKELAQQIATENGLDFVYDYANEQVEDVATSTLRASRVMNLRHGRLYQDRETPLHFLNRLANRYGIKFNVKGDALTYITIYQLHSIEPVTDVVHYALEPQLYARTDRSPEWLQYDETQNDILNSVFPELRSYDLRDCQDKDAAGIDVINYNPFGQEGFIYRLNAGADLRAKLGENFPSFARSIGADLSYLEDKRNANETERLKRRIRMYEEVDNMTQAEVIAMAHLFEATTSAVEGSVDFEGTPVAQAGTNIQIRGLRWLDGKYHISKSYHDITRNAGYTTRVDVKMVGLLSD